MTSDIYVLERFSTDNRAIPAEAEKVARYNDLDKQSSMRLRLLAEEMICMLPQLLIYGKGRFWIENNGRDYELHLHVEPNDIKAADRNSIINVSTEKKNAAAVGLINKICNAVEIMRANRDEIVKDDPFRFLSTGMIEYSDHTAWSLMSYRDSFDAPAKKENNEAWDELEKSIIGNLADDVIVGVLNGKVDIVVKKSF